MTEINKKIIGNVYLSRSTALRIFKEINFHPGQSLTSRASLERVYKSIFYSMMAGTRAEFIILQVTARKEGTFATFSFMQIRSRCSKILLLPAYQGFPGFMNFRVNLCWRRPGRLFTSFVKRSRNFAPSASLGYVLFKINDSLSSQLLYFFFSQWRAISVAIATRTKMFNPGFSTLRFLARVSLFFRSTFT